jgi:hypothetical protein
MKEDKFIAEFKVRICTGMSSPSGVPLVISESTCIPYDRRASENFLVHQIYGINIMPFSAT